VIGLGNPLMGDDGLGLAALDRLRAQWELPATVRLVDGGTWGMNLLPLLEDAEAVVLIDAIDAGRVAGELVLLERDEVPRFLGLKLSFDGLAERDRRVFAALRQRGIPVAVAMAGGYGRQVDSTVAVHRRTLQEALDSWRHWSTGRSMKQSAD